MQYFYDYPMLTHLVATIVGALIMLSYIHIKNNEIKILSREEVSNHSVFIYLDKKIDELRRIKLKNDFRTKVFQNHFRNDEEGGINNNQEQ